MHFTTPTVQGMKNGSTAVIVFYGFLYGIICTATIYTIYLYYTEPNYLTGNKDTWFWWLYMILSWLILYFILTIGGLHEIWCDSAKNQ